MSTYTDSLGLVKQTAGENPTVWMDVLNGGLLDLVDQALAQSVSIDLTSGDVTLTSLDGAIDEARAMRLVLTGTANAEREVVVPSHQKFYVVVNNCGQNCFINTATGTGAFVLNGQTRAVIVDEDADDCFLIDDVFDSTVEMGDASQTSIASTVSNATAGTSSPTIKIEREGAICALTITDYPFTVTVNSTSFVITPNAGSYPVGVDAQDFAIPINEGGTVVECYMRVAASSITFFKASGAAWSAGSQRFVPPITVIVSEAAPP